MKNCFKDRSQSKTIQAWEKAQNSQNILTLAMLDIFIYNTPPDILCVYLQHTNCKFVF